MDQVTFANDQLIQEVKKLSHEIIRLQEEISAEKEKHLKTRQQLWLQTRLTKTAEAEARRLTLLYAEPSIEQKLKVAETFYDQRRKTTTYVKKASGWEPKGGKYAPGKSTE